MKKAAVITALTLVGAFILATALKQTGSDRSTVNPESDTLSRVHRDSIGEFWELYNQAEQHRIAGNSQQALDSYRTALRIDPTHENSLYQIGNLYCDVGRYDLAERTLQQLIEVNPMSSRAHRRLGDLLSQPQPGARFDLDEAKSHFEAALRLNREESGPYLSLGRLLVAMGETETGNDFLEQAVNANPRYVEAYRAIAYDALLSRRFDDAMTLYIQALVAGGVDTSPEALPGEGDTEQSLKAQSPASDKNIASLYGLATAALMAGGYSPDAPNNCRLELPNDDLLKDAPVTWQPGPPAAGAAAWCDLNDDGRPELVTVGVQSPLQVWSTVDKDRFADQSADYGLNGDTFASDLSPVDFDSDGDIDLYLLQGYRFGPRKLILLRNDSGHFVDATHETGLSQLPIHAVVAFADFEQDGRSDLVVVTADWEDDARIYLYSVLNGYFREEWSDWITGASGWPTDVAVGDYDGDGYFDLFITTWRQNSLLLKNERGQYFKEVTQKSGLQVTVPTLAALFIDFNNDGLDDLFISAVAAYEDVLRSVLNLSATSAEHRPRLYISQGDGRFVEATSEGALQRQYGTLDADKVDFNADGYDDIFLANGGLEFGRFEPDALLLNDQGRFFKCRYTARDQSKSLAAAVGLYGEDRRPSLFVTRGGFMPRERQTTGFRLLKTEKRLPITKGD